ncbi:MAG: hypothetical protein K2Z81_19570, partial [Cyanobacteria bacterium]|nr:hypothetical protein [Cyanobacteriota bacterium]
ENIGILAGRISSIYLRLGRIDAAERWLSVTRSSITDGGSEKLGIEAFAREADLRLYQGNLDEANDLLMSAHKIIKKFKIHPDMGCVDHLLGKLHSQRQDWDSAAHYYSCASAIRRRLLPKSHVLIKESLSEYAAAAENSGQNADGGLARHELSSMEELEAEEDSELVSDAIPRRKKPFDGFLFVILALFGLHSLWMLTWEGFRAGFSAWWENLFLVLAIGVGVHLWRHHKKRKRAKSELLLRSMPAKKVGVSIIKFSERSDMGGFVWLARLGQPLNCERAILDQNPENEILAEHLVFYSTEHQYDVRFDGDTPVAIDLPHGLIQLSNLTGKSALADFSERRNKCLGWLIVIPFIPLFLLLPLAWIHFSDGPLPGLTAYEYYRYAASRIESDWNYQKYPDLKEIRDSLQKASALDPNGFIGQLSKRCENSELPHIIPGEDILEKYHDATSGEGTDASAQKKLQECIQKCPQFDWAYTELAELETKHGNLDRAKQFLEQARAINPISVNYLLACMRLQVAEGDNNAALETARQVQQIDPFSPHIYQRLIQIGITPQAK